MRQGVRCGDITGTPKLIQLQQVGVHTRGESFEVATADVRGSNVDKAERSWEGGLRNITHGRSRMNIDSCTPTISGRSTSGLY